MTYDDRSCLCGGSADHCALEGSHTGPRARMAEAHDRELAERVALEAYDRPAPRAYASEPCACAERRALLARASCPTVGVCRPCTARRALGLAEPTAVPANDHRGARAA